MVPALVNPYPHVVAALERLDLRAIRARRRVLLHLRDFGLRALRAYATRYAH